MAAKSVLEMSFDEYLANPGDPDLKALFDEADRIAKRGELLQRQHELRMQVIRIQAGLADIDAELQATRLIMDAAAENDD